MGMLRFGATALALAASVHSINVIAPIDGSEVVTETLTRFIYTCPCDSTTSLSYGTSYPTQTPNGSEENGWYGWDGKASRSSGGVSSTIVPAGPFTTTVVSSTPARSPTSGFDDHFTSYSLSTELTSGLTHDSTTSGHPFFTSHPTTWTSSSTTQDLVGTTTTWTDTSSSSYDSISTTTSSYSDGTTTTTTQSGAYASTTSTTSSDAEQSTVTTTSSGTEGSSSTTTTPSADQATSSTTSSESFGSTTTTTTSSVEEATSSTTWSSSVETTAATTATTSSAEEITSSTTSSAPAATTSTGNGGSSPIEPGTPFVCTANIGGSKLRRRDLEYLAFVNDEGALIADSTQAVPLVIDASGALKRYSDLASVGSYVSTGYGSFRVAQGENSIASGWSIGSSGLEHSSASFCLAADGSVYVTFEGTVPPFACTSVGLTTTTDCTDCNLPDSGSRITTTATTLDIVSTTTTDTTTTSDYVTTTTPESTAETTSTSISESTIASTTGDSTTSSDATSSATESTTIATSESTTIAESTTSNYGATTTSAEYAITSADELSTTSEYITTSTTESTLESTTTTTSDGTEPPSPTTTTPMTTMTMTITTSDASTTTMSADESMPSAGQPFSIQVELNNGLNKRDIMVVGFVNGQLVLVSSPADAVAFVLTPSGILMIFNTGLVVGFGGGSGTSALMIYSSVDAMPTIVAFSLSGGALVLPGAGFCIGAGNVMSVTSNGVTDPNCAPVTPKPDTAVDSFNTDVASTVSASPQTSTSSTIGSSTTTVDASTTSESLTSTTIEGTSTTVSSTTTSDIISSTTTSSSCVPTTASVGDTVESDNGRTFTNFFASGCGLSLDWQTLDFVSLYVYQRNEYSFEDALKDCANHADVDGTPVFEFETDTRNNNRWVCWTLNGQTNDPAQFQSYGGIADAYGYYDPTRLMSTTTTTSTSTSTTTSAAALQTVCNSSNNDGCGGSCPYCIPPLAGALEDVFCASLAYCSACNTDADCSQWGENFTCGSYITCSPYDGYAGNTCAKAESNKCPKNQLASTTTSASTSVATTSTTSQGSSTTFISSDTTSMTTTESTSSSTTTTTATRTEQTNGPNCSIIPLPDQTAPNGAEYTQFYYSCFASIPATVGNKLATLTMRESNDMEDPTTLLQRCVQTAEELGASVFTFYESTTDRNWGCGLWSDLTGDDSVIEDDTTVFTMNAMVLVGYTGPDNTAMTTTSSSTTITAITTTTTTVQTTIAKATPSCSAACTPNRTPASGKTQFTQAYSGCSVFAYDFQSALMSTTYYDSSANDCLAVNQCAVDSSNAGGSAFRVFYQPNEDRWHCDILSSNYYANSYVAATQVANIYQYNTVNAASTTTTSTTTIATTTVTSTTSSTLAPTATCSGLCESYLIKTVSSGGKSFSQVKEGCQTYNYAWSWSGATTISAGTSDCAAIQQCADFTQQQGAQAFRAFWVPTENQWHCDIGLANEVGGDSAYSYGPAQGNFYMYNGNFGSGSTTTSSVVVSTTTTTSSATPTGTMFNIVVKADASVAVAKRSTQYIAIDDIGLSIVVDSQTEAAIFTISDDGMLVWVNTGEYAGEYYITISTDSIHQLVAAGGYPSVPLAVSIATDGSLSLSSVVFECVLNDKLVVSTDYMQPSGCVYATVWIVPIATGSDGSALPTNTSTTSSTIPSTTATSTTPSTVSTTTTPACSTPSALGDVQYNSSVTFGNFYSGCGESFEGSAGGLGNYPAKLAGDFPAPDHAGYTFDDAFVRCVSTAVWNDVTVVEFYVDVDDNWLCVGNGGVSEAAANADMFTPDSNVVSVWGFVWENQCQNSPMGNAVASDGTIFTEFYTGCSTSLQGNLEGPDPLRWLNRVVSVNWAHDGDNYYGWTLDSALRRCADDALSASGTVFEFYIDTSANWYCVAVNDKPATADSFLPDSLSGITKVWGFALAYKVCNAASWDTPTVTATDGTVLDQYYYGCGEAIAGTDPVNGGYSTETVQRYNFLSYADKSYGGWTLDTAIQRCADDVLTAGGTIMQFYITADEEQNWYCVGMVNTVADDSVFQPYDTIGQVWAFNVAASPTTPVSITTTTTTTTTSPTSTPTKSCTGTPWDSTSVQASNGVILDQFYYGCGEVIAGTDPSTVGYTMTVADYSQFPSYYPDVTYGGWTLDTAIVRCADDVLSMGATIVQFYIEDSVAQNWWCVGMKNTPADESSFVPYAGAGKVWAFQVEAQVGI